MQPNDILYCEKTNSTEMIFQTLSEMLTEYVKEKTTEGPASKTAGPTKYHDRGVVNVVYEKKLLEVTA